MAEQHDLLQDFEQVSNISSSVGDKPEEDRYDRKADDYLGEFGSSDVSQSGTTGGSDNLDDLVNFMSSSSQENPTTTVTESTPPPSDDRFDYEPSKPSVVEEEQPEAVSGVVGAQGNLLKNVDPRDEAISSSTNVEPEMAADDNVTQPVAKPISSSSNGVLELVYWKDPKKTGVVFGTMMFILISLACFTLLSVVAYLSLAVLTVTFTFRVYKNVMQAVQKSGGDHPFKKLMEMDIELSDEVVKKAADNIARHMNCCSRELRRLYLVGDYVDSLKFGLLLWVLTYIGAWFNGMTLIILAVVSIFTLPKVYDTYKVQIDSYINMARCQLNKIMAQITSKIPFPKKKAKTQ